MTGGDLLGRAPTRGMGIVMVTYNGHIVGFCTARSAHLVDGFNAEIDGERIGPFLLCMCAFAGEVLNGRAGHP